MTGYFFNGALQITPAAMTKVNDAALLPQSPDLGNTIALVGAAAGGQPNTLLAFGNPQDAKATLAKGDLLDAVIRAFNPSVDTAGPATVYAIRVNPALQATLALKDGVAATVINLTSTGYGLRENQIKVKVEAATGGRGAKLTTARGSDTFVGDNIYRNAFSVQYTGGAASAVMSVSQTTVTLQAPSGSTVDTIDLNTFPSIQELVDRINSNAGFAAAVLDGNGAQVALNGLDTVAAQDVKSASFTAKADLQAAIDWFNSSGEGFVSAARAASVGTVPAVLGFTYLAGGSDGVITNTQWTNAFTVLQTADVQWVVPLSNDPSIHAMADAHVQFMSSTGRKERRAICGSPLATSDATAITLAKAINSDRTGYVHLGGYDYDVNGVYTLYQPYIVAAMLAAMFAGVAPGTPLTNKALRLSAMERKLRNPTDTDLLLLGGVMPIEDGSKGIKVVQSISTWLTTAAFNRRELSVGVALDYACRLIRDRVAAACKGKKNDQTNLTLALTTMETACLELAKPESAGGVGVLAGNAASPPFTGLRAFLQADSIALSGQLSPVLPGNYFPITINAVPFSGSATIS